MNCIYCGGKTKVVNTYKLQNKNRRRQRVCQNCNQSFNTTEVVDKRDLRRAIEQYEEEEFIFRPEVSI